MPAEGLGETSEPFLAFFLEEFEEDLDFFSLLLVVLPDFFFLLVPELL